MIKRSYERNDNRRNNGPKKYVNKTYTFSCTTVEDALDKLLEAHPVIEVVLYATPDANYKINKEYEEDTLLEAMIRNVISYTAMNVPNVEVMGNMRTILTLRPNKMFIQTNDFVGFGWFISYDKKGRDRSEITSVDLTITLSGQRSVDGYEDALLMTGWKIKEDPRDQK
ncbi:MAG: hypothetical protein PHC62_00765 [Candidatus Izemoplasmatales bacterium]|nr:hypothetical protein [Candidatus Izemoplasmatales bacterium]